MSSQTQSCGSAADSGFSGSDAAWSNPGNIVSSGSATFSFADGGKSDYLSAYDFDFSIPDGATIDGIAASVTRSCNADSGTSFTEDYLVSLTFNGGSSATATGSNYAAGSTKWPTSGAAANYGTGTTDLWGASGDLTVANINSSSFGLVLSCATAKSADTATVTGVSLTVYFTGGGSPPSTPTDLAVANDATNPTTELDISWTASTGSPTEYVLHVANSIGGTVIHSDTIAAPTTSATDGAGTSLTPATEYAYEIYASNGSGDSSESSWVAWATASAAPSGVSATAATGAALVAWTAPTMGTNCQIASYSIRYEYPPGNGNWTTITGISSGATSDLITGLTPGTEYGFEVACLIESTNADWAGTIQNAWGAEEDATPMTGVEIAPVNVGTQAGTSGLVGNASLPFIVSHACQSSFNH